MTYFNWRELVSPGFSNQRRLLLFSLSLFVSSLVLTAGPAFCGKQIAEKKSTKNSIKKSTTKAADHDADEQAIRTQAQDYSKAFAAGDTQALTSMWADDAVFTDQFGEVFSGRDAIAKQMASFFKTYGIHALEIKIDALEFPAANLAIEHGQSHVGSSESPASFTTYTAVHIKRDGKWLMVNVAESPRFYAGAYTTPSIADLSWLIGNWKVEGPKGELRIKADWVAGKKIIRCDFEVSGNEGEKSAQTQFIFFDPLYKRISSWQYDSGGGYGESIWINSGANWSAEGCSVQSDGSTGSARYVIRKLDHDTFSWHSTSRKILGRRLPDTAVLTAKRIGG